MLVSAVSANHFQSSNKIADNLNNKNKPERPDCLELVFNLNSVVNKKVSIEKLNLYNSINEWKEFCHKQILNGKLDVIA